MTLFAKFLDASPRKLFKKIRCIFFPQKDSIFPAYPEENKSVEDFLGSDEYQKLLSIPRGTRGVLNYLGMKIEFTDPIALMGMLDEIFIRKNYLFSCEDLNPTIIDCGANIGIAVVFFKMLFPGATVIAIEPDPKVFECLKKNVELNGLANVELINAAAWVNSSGLKFYSDQSWGGGLIQREGLSQVFVPSIDFRDLLNKKIDFLKMDIEGAENTVIPHCLDLIGNNVSKFFFEWHSLKGVTQSLGFILESLVTKGFRFHIKEASHRPTPFNHLPGGVMDSQLDIFLYK